MSELIVPLAVGLLLLLVQKATHLVLECYNLSHTECLCVANCSAMLRLGLRLIRIQGGEKKTNLF